MPDPLQTCGWKSVPAVGLPLIAMLPVAPAAALTADLNGPNGLSETSLGQTLCIVDQYTYTTSDSVYGPTGKDILNDDHAVLLIPRVPLVNGTYSVAIHQVGQPDIAWSFNVLSSASSPALGAPAHLSYKRSGRRVTVSWAKVSGASSYRVSIKINGRTRVIRTGSLKTSFQASTRHSARVTVRGVGTGGKLGRSVSLTVARYH
jgi:hypothetical protein